MVNKEKRPEPVQRLPMAPADIARLIEAGKIPESEVPRFETFIEKSREYYRAIKEDSEQTRTPKQQIELLNKAHTNCSRVLNHLNGLTFERTFLAHRIRVHWQAGLSGYELDDAVLRDLAALDAAREANSNLRELLDGAVLENSQEDAGNALKPASDFVVWLVLMNEAKRGRLGDAPPTADSDRLVMLVRAVVEIVEGEPLSLSATRRRIEKQFSRAQALANPIRPDLTAERTKRARWYEDAQSEYLTNPSVSREDAHDYAAALPYDPASDPRQCAREDMADWLVIPV